MTHQRLSPVTHAFTYPATFFAFDLAELRQIAQQVAIFSHNQRNLLSLHDTDYLYGKESPIREQLDALIAPEREGEHTLLISSPRYFGYAFNPVNFHLRMAADQLVCAVAEVNNTFGDRHVYPLKTLAASAEHTWTSSCPKAFHVSPFNTMEGDYHFTFKLSNEFLYMGVDLYRDQQCVLKTWIQGSPRPIRTASIFKYALLHPFDTALNSMPRIVWQAAQLYFRKRLAVHKRPSPASDKTLIDRDKNNPPTTIV